MSIQSVISDLKDSVDDSNRFIRNLEEQIDSVLEDVDKDIQELNQKVDELEETNNDLFLENRYLEGKIAKLELDLIELAIKRK